MATRAVLTALIIGLVGIIVLPAAPLGVSMDSLPVVDNPTPEDWQSDTSSEVEVTETATPRETGVDTAEVAAAVHERINQVRTERGLDKLDYDRSLAEIARGHSQSMAENVYFSHTGPQGRDFSDRYQTSGYDCRVETSDRRYATGAENIAYTFAYGDVRQNNGDVVDYNGDEKAIADGIVEQWMRSEGHRENILKEHWKSEGIGVAVGEREGEKAVYVTQNFC